MLKLPAQVSARIAKTINEGGLGLAIDEEAATHEAIALVGTIGAIWMLRPDGTMWDADADFGKSLTPLPEDLYVTALVAGTERYPWLRELLPSRPSSAADCATCNGKGRLFVSESQEQAGLFCRECNALGWQSP